MAWRMFQSISPHAASGPLTHAFLAPHTHHHQDDDKKGHRPVIFLDTAQQQQAPASETGEDREPRTSAEGRSSRQVKLMPTPLPRLSLHLAFLLSGTLTHAFRLGTRTPATALCFPHRALSSTSTCSSKALVSSLVFSTSRTPSSSSSIPSSLSRSLWDSRSRSIESNAQSNRSVRQTQRRK